MIRRILNVKILALVLVTVNTAHAMDLGVGFNFSTTRFIQCQHICDAINSKQELFCSPHVINKESLLKEIKRQKRKLEKCEKRALIFHCSANIRVD
jgi:hypothetical protein